MSMTLDRICVVHDQPAIECAWKAGGGTQDREPIIRYDHNGYLTDEWTGIPYRYEEDGQ